jgi:hypothetical protein
MDCGCVVAVNSVCTRIAGNCASEKTNTKDERPLVLPTDEIDL